MRQDPEPEAVVALVIMRPASGQALTGQSVITAATLPQYRPDPGAAAAVSRLLSTQGFSVGPLAGIGMSMTGPRELFERFFGISVGANDDGGWTCADAHGAVSRSLPLGGLDDSIRHIVHTICFEEPAELAGA